MAIRESLGKRLLQADPSCVAKVYTVVLHMLRWRKFSESRWATIGPACRAVVCSLAIGLDQLITRARANPSTTDAHLHVYGRMSTPIKQYMIVVGVVSFVADAMLYEIMRDDRLARRPEALEETLIDELKWVESISDATWDRLAGLMENSSTSGRQ